MKELLLEAVDLVDIGLVLCLIMLMDLLLRQFCQISFSLMAVGTAFRRDEMVKLGLTALHLGRRVSCRSIVAAASFRQKVKPPQRLIPFVTRLAQI